MSTCAADPNELKSLFAIASSTGLANLKLLVVVDEVDDDTVGVVVGVMTDDDVVDVDADVVVDIDVDCVADVDVDADVIIATITVGCADDDATDVA